MSGNFNCIIVDDEPLARKGLKVRLMEHEDVTVLAECQNGREALDFLKEQPVDLMFLDIQMPGMTGFEVVETLIQSGSELPNIIFVTAFDQFAINAFEVHALDYLLKPADENRLAQALEKFRELKQSEQDKLDKEKLAELVSKVTGNDSDDILSNVDDAITPSKQYSDILAIKDGSELTRVPVASIQWIDAAGDYMCVHTEENTHILRKTMKELEESLNPEVFIRCHRSVIVNKACIEKYCSQVNGEYYLLLKNGKELKVSRSYREKVKLSISY